MTDDLTQPAPPPSPIEEAVAQATPTSEQWVTASPHAPRSDKKPSRLTDPVSWLAVLLAITTILFGLMALAPRIAPLKLGASKLAAKAQEEQGIKKIAERFARNFVTIDYRTIAADFKRMEKDATGDFLKQLDSTQKVIEGPFKKEKASSTGKVLDSAVLSHKGDDAVVQILISRTKKNRSLEKPETGNQVVNVTLVNTKDGWKVSNLSQLGSSGQ